MPRLAALLFFQMLPATLVVPAIRPLFAAYHGGAEGPMHAFMSLNMLGAAIAVPIIGAWVDRLRDPRVLFTALAATDAALLLTLSAPLPTALVLALRTFEGAAHVGAATVLLAQAAGLARARRTGHTMGIAGAAIIGAVVLGSAVGGALLTVHVAAPFVVGALSAATVAAVVAVGRRRAAWSPSARSERRGRLAWSLLRQRPSLWVPVGAAFVARFTIGCVVVTFALFAHHAHGLSDAAVGGLFALMTFPFALAMYPAARATDRASTAVVMATGMIFYAIALAAIGRVPTAGLPVVMLLAGIASGLIFASTLCYTARLAGESDRGRAMALINVAGCLGMLLGPPAAGITTAVVRAHAGQIAGYRAGFLLAAGSLVIWLLVCARWLVRRARQERPAVVRLPVAVASATGADDSAR